MSLKILKQNVFPEYQGSLDDGGSTKIGSDVERRLNLNPPPFEPQQPDTYEGQYQGDGTSGSGFRILTQLTDPSIQKKMLAVYCLVLNG